MKRKTTILPDLVIESYAAGGKGLGKHQGKAIFVPHTVAGDVVDVQLTRNKPQWAEAKVIAWKTYSPLRISPKCIYFGHCGGCKWQMLPYAEQVRIKQQEVHDTFFHHAKLDVGEELPIQTNPSEYHYRNKMDFSFSSRTYYTTVTDEEEIDKSKAQGALGLHVPGRFDKVLPIHTCWLMDDAHNAIRNTIFSISQRQQLSYYDVYQNQGILRSLQIRHSVSSGEWLIWVIFGESGNEDIKKTFLQTIAEELPQLAHIHYADNPKLNDSLHDITPLVYKGVGYMEEKIEHLRFRIDAKSFFQTNSVQCAKLYEVIRDFAHLQKHETLYDLYCGMGTIGLYLAQQVRRVVGVEMIGEAIQKAKENSTINQIDHCEWIQGEAEKMIDNDFLKKYGHPDCIVLDPPRGGLHPKLTQKLLEIKSARIIYVSCNPATQARDLQILSSLYSIEKMQAVDMFPQTHHIENVTLLVLRATH